MGSLVHHKVKVYTVWGGAVYDHTGLNLGPWTCRYGCVVLFNTFTVISSIEQERKKLLKLLASVETRIF